MSQILLIIAKTKDIAFDESELYPKLLQKAFAPHKCRIHYIIEDQKLELLPEDKAVVIGGSPHCLDEDLPWMDTLKEFIRKSKDSVKFFGICFGHQIIMEALGGKVAMCPHGGKIGVTNIKLTNEGKEDQLFKGLPESFDIITAHRDLVITPPSDAVVLAHNKLNPYQALDIGENIRTIQFHPEMDKEYLLNVLHAKKELFIKMGVIHDDNHLHLILKKLEQHKEKASELIIKNALKWMMS